MITDLLWCSDCLGALQVWDKRAQAQVLQVAPFLPRRSRTMAASAQEMAAEMERVQVLSLSWWLPAYCRRGIYNERPSRRQPSDVIPARQGKAQPRVVRSAAGGAAGPARPPVLGLQRGADAGCAEAGRGVRQAGRLAARPDHAAPHHAPHLSAAQGVSRSASWAYGQALCRSCAQHCVDRATLAQA